MGLWSPPVSTLRLVGIQLGDNKTHFIGMEIHPTCGAVSQYNLYQFGGNVYRTEWRAWLIQNV